MCRRLVLSTETDAPMIPWAELEREPPPWYVNMKTRVDLMKSEELELNFELWRKVVVQDMLEHKMVPKRPGKGRPRKELTDIPEVPHSPREEVRAHIIEMVLIAREITKRVSEGRAHAAPGLVSPKGGGRTPPE